MFLNGANILGFAVKTAVVMSLGAVIAKVALAQEVGLPGVIWALVGVYSLTTIAPFVFYLPRILAKIHDRASPAPRAARGGAPEAA
jgi:hypothetical protein